MPEQPELEQHLFRRESGRIVAALTRVFGVHQLELAQGVAQDAICQALELWTVQGVPENPGGWLMQTAKNRALGVLGGERTAQSSALDEAASAETVRDEQLRLMLSCCQASLPEETQLALLLNLLCGFRASEIAAALFGNQAAIEQRLSRGKRTLADGEKLFELTDETLAVRLDTLRRALYLLFNEGYHGASAEAAVRVELCHEAFRLTALLCEHPVAATPTSFALAALMCLNAARLPGRLDAEGELSAVEDQDRSRWDLRLIGEGLTLLERSASGDVLTAYHLEAAIAGAHTSAPSLAETDWSLIVSLYERLMRITPSPVVAMNRAIALAERDGPEPGLLALHAIEDRERLADNPCYAAALGELEQRRGHVAEARQHFLAALQQARNDAERRFLGRRLSRFAAEA